MHVPHTRAWWQRGFESPLLRFALGHTWLHDSTCLLGERALKTPTSLVPHPLPVTGLQGRQILGHMEGRGAEEKGSGSNTGGTKLTSRVALGRRLKLFLVS